MVVSGAGLGCQPGTVLLLGAAVTGSGARAPLPPVPLRMRGCAGSAPAGGCVCTCHCLRSATDTPLTDSSSDLGELQGMLSVCAEQTGRSTFPPPTLLFYLIFFFFSFKSGYLYSEQLIRHHWSSVKAAVVQRILYVESIQEKCVVPCTVLVPFFFF